MFERIKLLYFIPKSFLFCIRVMPLKRALRIPIILYPYIHVSLKIFFGEVYKNRLRWIRTI